MDRLSVDEETRKFREEYFEKIMKECPGTPTRSHWSIFSQNRSKNNELKSKNKKG